MSYVKDMLNMYVMHRGMHEQATKNGDTAMAKEEMKGANAAFDAMVRPSIKNEADAAAMILAIYEIKPELFQNETMEGRALLRLREWAELRS